VTSKLLPLPQTTAADWRPEREPIPLVARQLTRELGGRPVVVRADLVVAAGEIVVLSGDNGAGKTTLLRCLAGRLRPIVGEVLWFGGSPSPLRRPLIGFAGHESHLYPELTASENLLFAARMYGLPQPRQRVLEMLAKTGLERHAGQAAGRLSQGLRQRVSLAAALLHDPPLVLLDEPFAGLDAAGRAWLEDWLRELRTRQRAIVFSSHDDWQCHVLADRWVELRCGQLLPPLAAGSPNKVRIAG
jgi:heme ABC exporter ATP-binding subunit CcmA